MVTFKQGRTPQRFAEDDSLFSHATLMIKKCLQYLGGTREEIPSVPCGEGRFFRRGVSQPIIPCLFLFASSIGVSSCPWRWHFLSCSAARLPPSLSPSSSSSSPSKSDRERDTHRDRERRGARYDLAYLLFSYGCTYMLHACASGAFRGAVFLLSSVRLFGGVADEKCA